jgi:hypothetical protein
MYLQEVVEIKLSAVYKQVEYLRFGCEGVDGLLMTL